MTSPSAAGLRPARLAAAVVLALHGLVHIFGFVVPWHLAAIDGFPDRDAILGGLVPAGTVAMQLVGVAWLVVAIGFVVAAAGLVLVRPWAPSLAAALAVVSIVLCVLGAPEALTGIPVDLAILAGWSLTRIDDRRRATSGEQRRASRGNA